MFRKTSRLITITIIAVLLLSFGVGATAADAGAAFSIYTIDGYSTPIGGASFILLGSDGLSLASATTGTEGSVTITIPATAIPDEGSAEFTLVQTDAPSGYETTENNWKVTVTVNDGKAAVNIATDGLWDTIFDWVEGSVITGSEYTEGTLTVANIVQYYDIPKCTKTVSGLSYSQMQGYISDYELTDSSGQLVATGHAIGFSEQGDNCYKADIVFDCRKLPAGTYALKETSVTEIGSMNFDGSKFMNNNGVLVVGEKGRGEVVYALYTAPTIHTPPVKNENSTDTNTSADSAESTLNSEETELAEAEADEKNDDDKSKDTKVRKIEIEDEKVPKAAKPKSSNTKSWIIVALASVIMIVAVIIMSKKAKSNI